MTSISIDTIAGPDGDSFKFDAIGDTVKGRILHLEELERENRFNGKTEKVLRISLELDDGETAIIWPVTSTDVNGNGYASRMAKAIAAAIRAAGETDLATGGILAVKFSGEQPTDKGNPAKLFQAQYKAPAEAPVADGDAADGAVNDLIG